VRLARSIPMVNNLFKPFFYARFEQRPDKVVLTGRFTMQPFVKMFISVWVGLAVAVGFMSLAAHGEKTAEAIGADMGAGVGMAVVGLAFAWVGKWFARNDIVWLSRVISGALDESLNPSLAPGAATAGIRGSRSGVPTVLLVVAGLLALGGLMEFARALFFSGEHALVDQHCAQVFSLLVATDCIGHPGYRVARPGGRYLSAPPAGLALWHHLPGSLLGVNG